MLRSLPLIETYCQDRWESKERTKQPNNQIPQVTGTSFITSSRYNNKCFHSRAGVTTLEKSSMWGQLLHICFPNSFYLLGDGPFSYSCPCVSLINWVKEDLLSTICVPGTLQGFVNNRENMQPRKKDKEAVHLASEYYDRETGYVMGVHRRRASWRYGGQEALLVGSVTQSEK